MDRSYPGLMLVLVLLVVAQTAVVVVQMVQGSVEAESLSTATD